MWKGVVVVFVVEVVFVEVVEKGKEKALYDQQPIEAAYMMQALNLAYKITREEFYKEKSIQTFDWFNGGFAAPHGSFSSVCRFP